MIAALYVQTGGVYFGLSGVDISIAGQCDPSKAEPVEIQLELFEVVNS